MHSVVSCIIFLVNYLIIAIIVIVYVHQFFACR